MNDIVFPGSPATWPTRMLKKLLWTAASHCALAGLYPWRLERGFVRIDRVPMGLPHLGEAFEAARVVHISDLHSSPLVSAAYLRHCVAAVNRLKPDFVAITGDFVTVGRKPFARVLTDVLSELRPTTASLAVLGNHDHGLWRPGNPGTPAMAAYLTDCLRDAGVEVLRNRSRTFVRNGRTVQFVGVAELWTESYDPEAAFRDVNPDSPVIALAHNPDAAADLAQLGAHWILAGHTHGRKTPAHRLARSVFPVAFPEYVAGRYERPNGASLYVNRGLGHARRARTNHKAEITLLTMARTDVEAPHRPAHETLCVSS